MEPNSARCLYDRHLIQPALVLRIASWHLSRSLENSIGVISLGYLEDLVLLRMDVIYLVTQAFAWNTVYGLAGSDR